MELIHLSKIVYERRVPPAKRARCSFLCVLGCAETFGDKLKKLPEFRQPIRVVAKWATKHGQKTGLDRKKPASLLGSR